MVLPCDAGKRVLAIATASRLVIRWGIMNFLHGVAVLALLLLPVIAVVVIDRRLRAQ